MTAPAVRGSWPRWLETLLLLGIVLFAAIGGLIWYSNTDAFQLMVRRRLVRELQRVTGAQVELGSLHAIPFRLHVEVRDLTLHGKEPPGSVPYAHVDSLVAQIKVISALGAEFGFHSIVLDHPVVHIIVNPDGSTNQPTPEVQRSSQSTPVEQLFALSISQLEVRHGELLFNDAVIPLDFSVDNLSTLMTYSILRDRYDCALLLGKVDTKLQNNRPFAWTAEAHFALEKNLATVRSLKATSGRTHFEVSGQVVDFRHPKLEGSYDLVADLGEIGAITRRTDVRRGVLQAKGRGSWSPQQFASAGSLSLKDFDWTDPTLTLRNASGSTDFTVDSKQLKLSQLQARELAGSFTGGLQITNWLSPAPAAKPTKGSVSNQQEGSARIQFKDVSVAEAATALSTRSLPLHNLNLVGTATGTMDIRWKGTLQNAEVETAFDVLPPLHVPSNQIPVTATGRATYRGLPGELEVKEFTLGTRGSQMHASGTLSKSAALKFSVNTTDLNEWQALISVLRGPTSIPVSLNGRAVLIATATGKTSDPVINGTLEADDFDLNVPATAHIEQKDIHWDSISTDLQVSQHNFAARRGHLLHDQTDIRFDVQAQLRDGDFTPDSGFTTHLNVHHMDVSEMLAIAGQNYPVQGLISFVAQGSGTRSDPHFDGQMRLSQGSAYGQPISQLNTNFSADSEHIEVTGLQLAQGKAEVSGSGSYNWDAQSFSTDLKGSSFDLANFHQLQGLPINMTGHLDFQVQGSGTVQAPDLNATLHLRDLTVDQEREGDFTLQAVTKGGAIELNGRSQFERSDLAVQGTVRYGGDWPADLQLVLNQLDVDPFLKLYLHDGVTGHSNVAGNIHVVGPLRQWRQLNVEANLSSFSANIEHVAVHNDGQLQFALANGTLNLQHLRLVGEGTDLTASGTAQLEGDQSLALQAQGHLNLHLIETINSDFTAAGSVAVDATLGGTLHEPLLHGQLQITKGSIAYIDLPSALSDIEGTVVFNQNRAEIQQLSAHVGGGLINLTGSASTYKGQFSFDLGAQAHEVRLRYPAGVSSTADLNLRFAGTSAESLFSGDITITKLALTPGVDFASYLGSASANASLPQTDRLLNRIRMDVHITTLPELQMQTAVVRLSGDADLHLRGTVAKPVLLGRVDVIEGQVSFNGTDYRLERGYIRFTNPVSTTPILDLQASTRVRDYDITLNVNGEADKPNITYRSEPPLATTDIIGLLAFGQTAEQSAQLQQSGQSPLAQVAGGAILSEALNSTVGNRVQRLFGVSRIKIDPQGLSTTTTPTQTGPAVTIEQQVKNDLTLTYSTSISEASQQIIQAEYNLTRNISIVGLRDQNGVVSFVVKFRKRKN